MSQLVNEAFDPHVPLCRCYLRIWGALLASPSNVFSLEPSAVAFRRIVSGAMVNWYLACLLILPIGGVPIEVSTKIGTGPVTSSLLYPSDIHYWLMSLPFCLFFSTILLFFVLTILLVALLLVKLVSPISVHRLPFQLFVAIWPLSLLMIVGAIVRTL